MLQTITLLVLGAFNLLNPSPAIDVHDALLISTDSNTKAELVAEQEKRFVTDGDKGIHPYTVPTCYQRMHERLTNIALEEQTGQWYGTPITTQNFDGALEQAYDTVEQELMTPSFWNAVIDGMGMTNNPFIQDARITSVSVDSGNPSWDDWVVTSIQRDDIGDQTTLGPSYYGDQKVRLTSTEPIFVTLDITWFDGRMFRIAMHLDEYILHVEHRTDVFGTHRFEDQDTLFGSAVFAGGGKELFSDAVIRSDMQVDEETLVRMNPIAVTSSESLVVDRIWRVTDGGLSEPTDEIVVGLIESAIQGTSTGSQIGLFLNQSQRDAIFKPIDEALGVIHARNMLLRLPHFANKDFLNAHYVRDTNTAFVCDEHKQVQGTVHPASIKPSTHYVEQGIDYNF